MKPDGIERREFLTAAAAACALTAAGTGVAGMAPPTLAHGDEPAAPGAGHHPVEARVDEATGAVKVNDEVIVRNTGCLGCYSSCGSRVRLNRDATRILTVGGNPYHPSCAYPYLPFEAPLDDSYRAMSFAPGTGNLLRGSVCGRGNASLDGYTQPDRITMPLKRAGARGEGRWRPISWDKLIDEVVEGGKIFAELGEDRHVAGFRELHDTETPLNPEQPDLGPVSNQYVALGGRSDGRYMMSSRFASAYGSTNFYYHASTCGGCAVASWLAEDYWGWTAPDLDNCEYAIMSGYFPGANGFNFQGMGKRVSARLAKGECKVDVLDPTLQSGCVTSTMKGINWVPLRTTTTSSVILAMVRWMFENDAMNTEFLQFPSQEAGVAGGYAAHTNASFLVIADEGHPNHGMLMRAADAGMDVPENAAEVAAEAEAAGLPAPEYFVVIDRASGEPMLNTACPSARVDFEGQVAGVKVRSALLYLRDSAFEHTMQEYEQITQVPVAEIERMAREFTSHGVKAAMYGNGSTVMNNGIDTAFGMRMMNALIGSHQMVGGCNCLGGTFASTGDGPRYLLETIEGLPDLSNAQPISRTGKHFADTDEYRARVAAGEQHPLPLLPWFGHMVNSDNQALVSIVNKYPYQAKILVSWMVNTLQATPGAFRDEFIERFKDPDVIPLHIACDVVVGEHAQYADYIVPDTNPFETFGCSAEGGIWSGFGTTVRWRVKQPETIRLDDGRYASYETFIVDVAKRLDLPGFGKDAIAATDGSTWDFNDASDFFLKAAANIAYDLEPVADVDPYDVACQRLDELPAEWKHAVSSEEWPKVLNVLSRGGRYLPLDATYGEGGRAAAMLDMRSFVYSEPRRSVINHYTGLPHSPVVRTIEQTFADGTPFSQVHDADQYPFKHTGYKPRFRSVSMLANSPIMQDICTSNYLEVNLDDARELGISDGDLIRAAGPTGEPMVGRAWVRAGIARGTFATAFGYGHRAYGAQDVSIEGADVRKGDPAIGAGIALDVMDDPTVKAPLYPIADGEFGSPGRNGGMYRIEKVEGALR
ncbi:molybdopterin-dependent oxidoreductase [Berryella wangjianweii]|uniref:Molybdopterin-dependent oxidoreductase n=1 Tax=Berryella wangjianweii TaxID=2734634 RepID=A0A6M8IXW6_9ACTN|nr:molybdopterin-dependent oxidoreductase [Berryella wangjianweii]QKF07695.1 molybdopterin-dependent oxidoreductase [Berryella wangjianweii]